MTFRCYGKSMGQKFLIPQTITVDLGTETKYQIDKILWIKRLKEKKPLICYWISSKLLVKMGVVCREEKKLVY